MTEQTNPFESARLLAEDPRTTALDLSRATVMLLASITEHLGTVIDQLTLAQETHHLALEMSGHPATWAAHRGAELSAAQLRVAPVGADVVDRTGCVWVKTDPLGWSFDGSDVRLTGAALCKQYGPVHRPLAATDPGTTCR